MAKHKKAKVPRVQVDKKVKDGLKMQRKVARLEALANGTYFQTGAGTHGDHKPNKKERRAAKERLHRGQEE